jgi:hypothetical protein
VNLADQVLGRVTGVPGLATLVPPRVRQKYPAVFGTDDTRFERLGGSAAVADGVARTDDATLVARDYAIRGQGTTTLDGKVDFSATLSTSDALTRDIVADVKEARYLADAQGRLTLPVRIAGTPPALRATPDPTAVANALARGLVDKGVGALLGEPKKPKPGQKQRPEDALREGLRGLLGP